MRRSCTLTLCLLLFAAVPALAQEPAQNTYGGAGDVLGDIVGQAPQDAAPPAGDEGAGGGPREPGADVRGIVEDDGDGAVPRVTTRPDDGGSLPFTGLDLGLLVAGGAMLLGMGVGMRRLSRSLA